MSLRHQPNTYRLSLRFFAESPPEARVVACLKVMAQAAEDKDLVMWLFFRHLMALAIAEFRAKAVS
jgi:hypothetical protein